MNKIGILGGTFNPVHISHIILARTALNELSLDKILFMPSKNPPHKQNLAVASNEDRLDMLKLAIDGIPGFEISDFELRPERTGFSYTYETLELLLRENDDTRYYFIIGGDSLQHFSTWYEPGRILERCALVCTGRAGQDSIRTRKLISDLNNKYSRPGSKPEIYYINVPQMDISSNMIRKYVSYDMSIDGLVSPQVSNYISEHRLFRSAIYDQYLDDMEKKLSSHRYEHVKNVAKTAVRLALIFGEDSDKAYTAGLLHDCAKYLDDEAMLAAASQAGIELDEIEKKAVPLVHAKVGAYFARTRYGIEDTDILNAILYHTTGRPGMSMLEKIIYIADYIEPGRKRMVNDDKGESLLNTARSIATYDLDEALRFILKSTVDYLQTRTDYAISDITKKTFEYYNGNGNFM